MTTYPSHEVSKDATFLEITGDQVEIVPHLTPFRRLVRLHLTCTHSLISLGDLPPSLRELRIQCSPKLYLNPVLPPKLFHLSLSGVDVKTLFLPPGLVELHLVGCPGLIKVSGSPALRRLHLDACQSLRQLRLPRLPEEFALGGPTEVIVPGRRTLPNYQTDYREGCTVVTAV